MGTVQTFSDNSIYVYFLSCIVIFSYHDFSKLQKISLIYATTIAMELISHYGCAVTMAMLLISMFILEEYLSDDKVKCELLSNIWYKLVDFIYQFIFIDMGLGIIINIILSRSSVLTYFVKKGYPVSAFYGVNIFVLLLTIHFLNTSKFGIHDFEIIKKHFDQYDGIKIRWDNDELQRKFDIMVALEDKSYFDRTQSYNWLSWEFIQYKFCEYKYSLEYRKQFDERKTVREICDIVFILIKKRRLFRTIFQKCLCKISDSAWSIKYVFGRLKSKIRGCSTLEMQLIRNIGIEKGYDKCVIRRKIFEFFYTYLFFNGLKKYYENTQNNKRKEFKKFILYVYLHTIKVSIGGNEFKSIDKLFDSPKVEEWDIDEFYIAILALTGAPVTPRRMVLYPNTIIGKGINLNRALVWKNMIKNYQITETTKRQLNESEVEPVFYVVRNCVFPLVENGVFYGPNDGKNDWPSYGEQNCWNFAMTLYWYIWNCRFSNKTGTDDDMMRSYNSLKERAITPENCRRYLGNAKIGAVIRICDDIKGNDRMGHYKHSQILLQRDNDGITIYESNDCNTNIEYFTWAEYASRYGKYKYFKYIKWPRN